MEFDNTNLTAKHKGKDSVFTDLFKNPKYALKMVQTIQNDISIREEDIQIITITPIFLNKPYNDLGIMVKDALIICSEAQSTWSPNILPRMFMYLAETYHQYILHHPELNIYGHKKISLPRPICTMIYTGTDRKNIPPTLSLNDEFFKGKSTLDLTIKIIVHNEEKNIIQDYISFCHIFNEQVKLYGYTLKAIEETITICLQKNILLDYLSERKSEVQTIMETLFSQEEAMKRYAYEIRAEGIAEGIEKGMEKGIKQGKYSATLEYIRNIMQKTNVTADSAMNILNIPANERNRYLSALS